MYAAIMRFPDGDYEHRYLRYEGARVRYRAWAKHFDKLGFQVEDYNAPSFDEYAIVRTPMGAKLCELHVEED